MIKEKSHTWAQISKKLGRLFSQLPFPPNFYTWTTLPIAIIGFLLLITGYVWSGVFVFIIAGIFDLIDGALARHLNCTSNRGAFLDGSLDRFIDFLLLFSYFWLSIHVPWLTLGQWIGIAIFFAIMPSFEVAYANHRQAVADPDETIIWRFLNRGEMYVIMLAIPVISLYQPIWAGYLLIILIVLSMITTLQTLWITLHLSNNSN